jgi:antitoxin (DNA-binding transcriptional repressor) of toxin-antitoxin stability system
MTATVEQLQSEWRKLIELAQRGEEVILTSQGRIVARLTGVPTTKPSPDRRPWLAELAKLRKATATGKTVPTSDEILEDLRSERN